ncbi:MAG TPA: hypothetical protein VM754_11620, partial [Actinomycetota bacterium]|nr:hypothetical protein [Actinomycetota bacterium]
MGGFRLGSSRKARGQQPPAPAETPGNGVPAVAAGVATRSRVPAADYGSMANPLAQSARKVTKNDVWVTENPSRTDDISSNGNNGAYSRPGRAERPRWATPNPGAGLTAEPGQQTTARWQPPAPAPAAAPV